MINLVVLVTEIFLLQKSWVVCLRLANSWRMPPVWESNSSWFTMPDYQWGCSNKAVCSGFTLLIEIHGFLCVFHLPLPPRHYWLEAQKKDASWWVVLLFLKSQKYKILVGEFSLYSLRVVIVPHLLKWV